MDCPRCGAVLKTDAAFCSSCGAPVEASSTAKLLLLTSNYAPGYKVDKVMGLVYGITVRSRGIGGNIVAGLRTIGGGEILEYTEMAHQARQQALDRLSEQAARLGANAVLSVLFDSNEIGNTMAEIIAFGTAVVISPAGDGQQLVKLS
jgi:uncharacterized protein YbjQ (UPF0145 family)